MCQFRFTNPVLLTKSIGLLTTSLEKKTTGLPKINWNPRKTCNLTIEAKQPEINCFYIYNNKVSIKYKKSIPRIKKILYYFFLIRNLFKVALQYHFNVFKLFKTVFFLP